MNGSALDVDGHRITVTHLDRVLYPQTGTRKYDVISYYLAVADALLPHIASRPVTRKRWPASVDGAPFFEKALPPGAPPWIARFTIGHAGGDKPYPVVRDAATLVWFAQMSALELHVPQWRIDLSDRLPEEAERRTQRLVLDLDPGPGVPLQHCAQVALTIRDVLTAAGMSSYPVTSGGSGIHVYARLPDPVRADSARTVARQIAVSLAQAYPDDVTATMNKAARPGKVFIDWSQNSATKTTLAPYSLRGRERPWVAAPRTWSELTEPDLSQLEYRQVLDRLADSGDLLSGLDPGPAVPPAEGVVDLGAYRRRRTSTDDPAKGPAIGDAAADHSPAGQALPTAPAPTSGAGGIRGATVVPLRPMLAVNEPVERLDQTHWAFEGKWDGYRILAQLAGGRLSLQSRSGIDMTADFPELAVLGGVLDGHEAVLDGEVVALNAAGQTDFRLLASRRREPGEATIRLFLFDVLEWDGTNLESAPWEQRREVLESLAPLFASTPAVQIPALLDPPGEAAVDQSRRNGWEGVVAKRRSSAYRQGSRSPDWRKQKNFSDLEVVIGGFRYGRERAGRSLGSVLVGLPQENGLRYLGRVGTGWTQAQAAELLDELRPLTISTCPFVGGVDAPGASSATWVLPTLVADVQFLDWTSTGHLRHPSWRGIRRDKLPGDL
ncbi:DNA ligase D [Gordonia hirsuta DSM 44140 = NBRC 16056]|uniref:DNA ligase (ATP) n=1 Tax=Gordonia hirsuta DSM 44140 = NBRC 16056 TaxID=1121927 RepID=L7L9K4_9ACTN|nr:non-homologous end-joining DNA ligase [Gordonia hirsuta]GAC57825.1 DNA ligase D [Gordonia hirsuta DSM 44140 = NBRC 16056]